MFSFTSEHNLLQSRLDVWYNLVINHCDPENCRSSSQTTNPATDEFGLHSAAT